MKYFWIKISILLAAFLNSSYTNIEIDYGIQTIVIDAGHGGKDNGCSGAATNEKTVALSIALKLGNYINRMYPNINIVYTRKKDVFLPLHRRAEIANSNKADLFVSIHCNAVLSKKAKASGTETFVMGLHTAAENLAMVKRENSVILMENNYQKNYAGLNPDAPENHILSSLYQNAHLNQSISLAEKIENQFKFRAKRKSRGVKQAGFAVLRYTTMPSVLVEAGFLTHPTEGAYLATDKGQAIMASAIFRAFKSYKQEVENEETAAIMQPKSVQEKSVTPPTYEPPVVKKSVVFLEDNTTKPIQIEFKIQLAATYNSLNTKQQPWASVKQLEIKKEGQLYKYLAGGFKDYNACKAKKAALEKLGFKDSFIVAYKNGERIQIKTAQKLLRNK